MSNSAQQDIAYMIRVAKQECEDATREYSRTGNTTRLNECNRRLGALNNELWRVDAGLADTKY